MKFFFPDSQDQVDPHFDFRTETIDVLARIGDAVPAAIELGYHLCYGSPADEHLVQPKDTGIMVASGNASSCRSPPSAARDVATIAASSIVTRERSSR